MILSRDEKINNLVKGKTVCICGPAAYLVESNLGCFIDSFDIVCRVSDFAPINYIQDYGRKNDIMFHVFSDLWYEIDEFQAFVCNNYNFYECIELFVCATLTKKPHGPFNKDVEELYDIYVRGFDKKPFTSITVEDFLKVKKELEGDFNTGMAMILMLLSCEIKSLFITGFSFYWESNQNPPLSAYYPGKTECFDCGPYCSLDEKGIHRSNHEQEHQKRYFIEKILKKYKNKIIIDVFLRNVVLNIHYVPAISSRNWDILNGVVKDVIIC